MEINLEGKRALIGGSTRGLGKAIAQQLAACGAQVTLMARNKEQLEKSIYELPCIHGQKHDYLLVDFQNYNSFELVVTDFFETQSVDILVNNTNGPEAGGVLEKGITDYQKAFDLLFKTYCLTGMEALKGMKKNRSGRIINVSSVSVREPLSNLVLSNSIRSAVVSWSKTLAREVAAWGITVNNILTGSFDTERVNEIGELQAKRQGLSLEEYMSQKTEGIPMKRLGRSEEYGFLVAFLASDYASYITGASIPIDGGSLQSI